ncbi:MAG: hypothetical protein KDA58_02415 [Planctomycetaceae bacterium]|nr:hypothetical protein [Planctomycetaceae bacterium]
MCAPVVVVPTASWEKSRIGGITEAEFAADGGEVFIMETGMTCLFNGREPRASGDPVTQGAEGEFDV